MKRTLLLPVLALSLAACATVQHGSVQRIPVDSEPAVHSDRKNETLEACALVNIPRQPLSVGRKPRVGFSRKEADAQRW